MKEEKRNKPKIRFPGYTGDWEQRKLPEFVEFYSGLTYTPDDVRESGTLVLRSSNVKNGEIVDADNVYVDSTKATSDNVQKGDIIVVVRNGSRALIGKHAEIKANMPNTVIGAFMTGIRTEHSSFVNALLDTPQFEREIQKNLGATINQITGYMFSEMKFYIPSSKEQDRIGACFNELDNLITLHQRKLDCIKEYKKAMLQKMFPKKGESVPEVRFPGFTGDWEQRKFEDFTWDAGKRNKDNLDLEPYSVTNDRGFIRQSDAHDEFGYMKNVDRKAYNIVPPNSFAYNPARINVGSIGYYEGTESVIVSSLYEVFQTADYIDDRFLWHWFKSDEFPKWIERLQEGSVRLYFYYDKLCECQILIPSVEEQKKISSALDSVDNLITLHQRELDKWKELKKGLLQQMFV